VGMTRSLHPFSTYFYDVYRCIPTALQQQYGSGGELAVDLDGIDPWARNRYQFLLPDYRFVYFDGSHQRPPANLVVAPDDWPTGRSDGFTPVTGEIGNSEALWVSTPRNRRAVQITLPSGRCPAVAQGS
jgi:hypothetical protein